MSEKENGVSSTALLEAFRAKEYVFSSLAPPNLNLFTRKEMRSYFENAYDLDEGLFSAIKDEKYFYMCPDRLRLPLIFYFGHTATLYVNKLLLAGLIKERVNRSFEKMFETGVDEMSWDDTENYRMGGSYQWPSLSEVMEYRNRVRELVIEVIENAPLTLPVTMDHPWWSIFMGLEHERIHIETSSVLIRQLPVDYLECPTNWKYAPINSPTPVGPNAFIKVNEGEITLGKPTDFPTYGWDNEYGTKTIKVPAFEATQYLITNKEFLDFVADGGYSTKKYWTDEGWQWVQFRQPRHPLFWVCTDECKSNCGSILSDYSHCNNESNGVTNGSTHSKYKYRALYDVIDMPWDWPVDVNYHEAKAYCRWKGAEFRLPTEAEHQIMRGDDPLSSKYSCDPINRKDFHCNFNFAYGSSTPVNFYPANSKGFYDLYGNVWECTEDHFNGFPGYESHYLYDDFSSPCFDGRHNMIQGGSWASTGDLCSRFARYAFRRHFYQHMGFRLVRSLSPSFGTPVKLCDCSAFVLGLGVHSNPVTVEGVDETACFSPSTNKQYVYDDEDLCHDCILNKMGKDVDYGQPLVKYVKEILGSLGAETGSAMVAGCGPGYTSFQLGAMFDSVLGMEFGGRLVDAAIQLQNNGEAVIGDDTVALSCISSPLRTDNVTFKQLTWFPNELEGFDLVLFEFLDRLNEPKGWLRKLWEIVNKKGILIISASDMWTVPVLKQYIGEWFELVHESNVDKIISTWRLKED
ncbi:PREDICTED: ergothioneine biosynthesis protein 1-like isoform X1 [Amphimedon queenslandica]|uniref:Sulfatase-modifying factor enzyme domain-containing protein n=1 Tax=Amphimedon queenslandica TaxID=400682 RepID=A0AAN0JCR5_AMPQE|nr:PREDICTED: ergothioneine biosynthesis protein 1-like isoform X1 [Amphimedon queenslandica]|eukprot:XP_019854503.1 PREDICTED: ergothioneine biosynthesis protein 1-like isoform X1 [Amphimedon queenslandica]